MSHLLIICALVQKHRAIKIYNARNTWLCFNFFYISHLFYLGNFIYTAGCIYVALMFGAQVKHDISLAWFFLGSVLLDMDKSLKKHNFLIVVTRLAITDLVLRRLLGKEQRTNLVNVVAHISLFHICSALVIDMFYHKCCRVLTRQIWIIYAVLTRNKKQQHRNLCCTMSRYFDARH